MMLLPHRRLGHEGPYMLLVHGYMVDGGMFMAVEEGLVRHYRLIIPDLRGYGDAWNWPGPYTFVQQVADLAELVQHYTQEPVWILGYSMGGALAQLFARQYPHLTKGLILGCTFAYKPITPLERKSVNSTKINASIKGVRYLFPSILTTKRPPGISVVKRNRRVKNRKSQF